MTVTRSKRTAEEEINRVPKKVASDSDISNLELYKISPSIELYDLLLASDPTIKDELMKFLKATLYKEYQRSYTFPENLLLQKAIPEANNLLAFRLFKEEEDIESLSKLLVWLASISNPQIYWIPSLQRQIITLLLDLEEEDADVEYLDEYIIKGMVETRFAIYQEAYLVFPTFDDEIENLIDDIENSDHEYIIRSEEELNSVNWKERLDLVKSLLIKAADFEAYEKIIGEDRDLAEEVGEWEDIAHIATRYDNIDQLFEKSYFECDPVPYIMFELMTCFSQIAARLIKENPTPKRKSIAKALIATYLFHSNDELGIDLMRREFEIPLRDVPERRDNRERKGDDKYVWK